MKTLLIVAVLICLSGCGMRNVGTGLNGFANGYSGGSSEYNPRVRCVSRENLGIVRTTCY